MNISKETSKLRTGFSKISRFDGKPMKDPFRRYMSQRQPIKTCGQGCAYCDLKASVVVQFLREDFGGVTSVRYNPGLDQVAVGYNFGYLQVFSEKSLGAPLTLLKGWEGHYPLTCVRFHPRDADLLYASSFEGVFRCNIKDQRKIDLVITQDQNEINSFDFDNQGGRLITGGRDASVRVYDVATNKMVTEYSRMRKSDTMSRCSTITNLSSISFDMHEKRVYCVKYSPDNPHMFLSGGWDEIVKLWDSRMPMVCARNIYGPYIFGEAIDICQGKVVTGSCVAANSLELWDLGSGALIQEILPTNRRASLFGEYPYVTQFYRGDPSGDLVLAGGTGLDGLQVISIKESRIVYLFEDAKAVLAVDSTDERVTFGGKSNTLLLGKMHSSKEIDSEEPSTSLGTRTTNTTLRN